MITAGIISKNVKTNKIKVQALFTILFVALAVFVKASLTFKLFNSTFSLLGIFDIVLPILSTSKVFVYLSMR